MAVRAAGFSVAQSVSRHAAELLLKREAGILSPEQFQALHGMIEPTATTIRRPTLETVRLWEYQAQLRRAGRLVDDQRMTKAYLYTPDSRGCRCLKDYQDLQGHVAQQVQRGRSRRRALWSPEHWRNAIASSASINLMFPEK